MNEVDNSIIISAFNEEDFIENSLTSLEKSIFDLEYIEVILINNGSSDLTKSKIESFLSKLNLERRRVYNFFSIKHLGLSEARNFGINKSKGEYLTFLDADAIIHKDCIVEIKGAFKKFNPDFISGNVKLLHNKKIGSYFLYKMHYDVLVLNKKSRFIEAKENTAIIGANMSFKKSVLTNGFFDEIKGRGDDTFLSYFLKIDKGFKEYYLEESIVYNDNTSSLIVWFKQQFHGGKLNGLIFRNFKTHFVVKKLFYIILLFSTITLFFTHYIFAFLIGLRFLYRLNFLFKSFLNVVKSKVWFLAPITIILNLISIALNDLGVFYGFIISKKIK